MTPEDPNLLLSSSRDKSVMVWSLYNGSTPSTPNPEDHEYGFARRALKGHSHFVSDVVISSDGAFALSASWDGELRLWDINTGKTTRRFVGHEKDVLSVAFSVDNRQIVSGSRDGTIRLSHCQLRMGQACQGLELDQLQAPKRPCRTHR